MRGLRGALRARARPRRAPARRARGRGGAGLGGGRQRRGRCPTAVARASSAASSRASRRASTARCRSTSARSTACSRSTRSRARRASGRGASGPRARGAAARARADPALLPAVVRALDARRLDRHARGRALRHRLDPHRRPRRVGARDHAERARGSRGACPARAPGRRPTGCCWAPRGSSGSITEAWVRVQPRPRAPRRAHGALRVVRRGRRGACARSSRPGCARPTCRLIDALEAARRPAPATASARCSCSASSRRTIRSTGCSTARWSCARTAAASPSRRARRRGRRLARRVHRAPYLRDALLRCGVLADTFETAITWERLPALHREVTEAPRGGARPAVPRHVPAHPRLPRRRRAVLHRARPGRRGDGDRAAGGRSSARRPTRCSRPAARSPTTTPSGAITAPWYDRQRPDPFAAALRGAKAAVDPRGLLNPGVLFD